MTLLCVGDCVVKRALGEPRHLAADGDTAFVQGFDGDLVASADFADDVFSGNANVIEDEFAGRGSTDAELVLFLTDLESFRVALDQEAGDAAIALIWRGVGEEKEDSGFGGVGDPELPAGDAKVISVAVWLVW